MRISELIEALQQFQAKWGDNEAWLFIEDELAYMVPILRDGFAVGPYGKLLIHNGVVHDNDRARLADNTRWRPTAGGALVERDQPRRTPDLDLTPLTPEEARMGSNHIEGREEPLRGPDYEPLNHRWA